MTHLKRLDDFLHTCVLVKPLNKLGYVWGGEPKTGIDTPDVLYVTIAGKEYEIDSSLCEAVLPNEAKQEMPFENTAGGEYEEAS